MKWYANKGKDDDVAISSRVRFARNIADYPFASKLTPDAANAIVKQVSEIFPDYAKTDFATLKPAVAESYVEEHLVSPEFAAAGLPHALLVNDEKSVAVMVCEEDHIRLQCILPGLSLDEAYAAACEADDILCERANIAYSEELGFLTHCPTNLGTGMRASVMLFLPALTMTGQLDRLAPALAKVGLTIRGMYGEGSEADGCLYQLSNQITLGLSEEDTIKKLGEVVSQLISRERKCRASLKSDSGDQLRDRIMRAYGTMKYAYMLTSKEFMTLFSDVRLGIALGYITTITYEKLGELMINSMPATLSKSKDLSDSERDLLRAKLVSASV